MKKHNVTRLDIELGDSQASPSDDQLAALQDLVSRCQEADVDSYLWSTGLQPQQVMGLLRGIAGLTGIVVDCSGFSDEVLSPTRLNRWAESCRNANLRLWLATDRVRDGMDDMPKEVGVIWSGDSVPDDPEQAVLDGRQVLADLAIADPVALATDLPDVRIARAAGRIAEAALAGARGFIVTIRSGGQYLPDSVSAIGLEALARLVKDPLQDTDSLWDKVCQARYGETGPQAKFVLQESTAANRLSLEMLGLRFLWMEDGLASLPQARARLELLADASAEQTQQSARSLLQPTDRIAGLVRTEGDTALWHVSQCVSGAEEAVKTGPGPQTEALSAGVARLQEAARLSQVASWAFIQTQLYAQDAAPRTLESAQGALEGLRNAATEASMAIAGSPMLEGVDAFIVSADRSLEESPQKAPIAQAFQRARNLSAEGRADDAAQALADILANPDFADHLDKHWQTVGQIASSLTALGMADADLEIRWGGDGQWKLEKVGGRWCCVTHERGPCLYLNVPGERLDPAADYILSFEYFDRGDWELWVQYDSDYPADQNRPYYPAAPLQLTDTNTWRTGSLVLTRCLFSGGENMESDMRFLSGKGACIRNIRLKPK